VGRGFVTALLSALTLLALPGAARAGPFSDWAVIVVAGDFHAHGPEETEAFDNARRDVAAALVARGFSAANIRQFSARPEHFPAPRPGSDNFDGIIDSLRTLTQRAHGGCLIYVSSHGAPQGILLGDIIMNPGMLANAIDGVCGDRPTVVVLSACFSGVFVPVMEAPNRMILTAARPDRTSFGCGVDNRYPFFDDCFLQVLPQSSDFADLAPRVQACVAQRETTEGMSPPSEPQVWVDPGFRPMLPLYRFSAAPPAAAARPAHHPAAHPHAARPAH
jgi:hypothetical protein